MSVTQMIQDDALVQGEKFAINKASEMIFAIDALVYGVGEHTSIGLELIRLQQEVEVARSEISTKPFDLTKPILSSVNRRTENRRSQPDRREGDVWGNAR